jgi:hypothetical protein
MRRRGGGTHRCSMDARRRRDAFVIPRGCITIAPFNEE